MPYTVTHRTGGWSQVAEDAIREALRKWQEQQGVSLREHARRLRVSPMSLSAFLSGQSSLGVPMARAIRATHPDLLHLLLTWLEGGVPTDPWRV